MKNSNHYLLSISHFLYSYIGTTTYRYIGTLVCFFIIQLSFAQHAIDSQTYNYTSGTNKLDHIDDATAASAYDDLDDQASGNYSYDKDGNLIKETTKGILDIDWTTSGKIKQVSVDDNNDGVSDRTLQFKYDAAGNRVKKIEIKGTSTTTYYYIRSSAGELISTYKDQGSGAQRENILITSGIDIAASNLPSGGVYTRKVGYKNYELKDEVGNVRVVLNDVKEPVSGKSTFTANVKYVADYYSFGSLLPGRNSISGYKFAFQGKEKDDEIKGNGDSYDFGARIYDPWVGRWLSIDPLGETTPQRTPYNGMGNNPVLSIDPTGMKEYKDGTIATADLGPGDWLTSDRENNTDRWDKANWYNIRNERENEYEPFTQIGALYEWVKVQEKAQGHDSRWIYGASGLVDDLARLDPGYDLSPGALQNAFVSPEMQSMLRELNVAICNFAIHKFNYMLVQRGADNPIKGMEAYNWDLQFIVQEQMGVAPPVYEKWNNNHPEVIAEMNRMVKGQSFGSWGNVMLGTLGANSSSVPQFETNVMDAHYRVDMPMMMLWWEIHQYNPNLHPSIAKTPLLHFLQSQEGLGVEYMPNYWTADKKQGMNKGKYSSMLKAGPEDEMSDQ